MRYADLHTHTYHSDGTRAPREVVDLARSHGITILAISDHDNLAAYFEAKPYADSVGVTLVPAAELSCGVDGIDVASGLGLHTYAPAKNSLLARLEPDAPDARFDYILTSKGPSLSFRVVAPPQLFLTEALGEPHEGPLFASDHFGIGVELALE